MVCISLHGKTAALVDEIVRQLFDYQFQKRQTTNILEVTSMEIPLGNFCSLLEAFHHFQDLPSI